MKTRFAFTLAIALCLTFATAHAQYGPRPGGRGMGMGPGAGPGAPRLDGSMAQLFGDTTAFSATMEVTSQRPGGEGLLTMPGKMAYDQGKARFEMDMTQMMGGAASPDAAAQMKSMGMDKMVMISRLDKKVHYMVYPGKQAYVENPMQQAATDTADDYKASDYKVESTELGKETVDGHACIKNKVAVTDKNGKKFEATVWNATDLKKFPVKIEHNDPQGGSVTVLYKDIKLAAPEASLFEPPAGATKCANMMELMMKGSGLGGTPPGDR